MDLFFLAGVLLLVVLTFVALAGANALGQRGAANGSPGAPRAANTPSSGKPSSPPNGLLVSTQLANQKTFSLPQAQAGAMWPTLDPSGNVWFGEMNTNHLARLDPRTGTVTEWTPPHGDYGIMQVLADGNGNIWFAEDGANYIGRFDPATQQFTTFPLGTGKDGHEIGPYAMRFDPSGKIWFTGVNSGVIGQFDPATGQIRTWQIPSPNDTSDASPDCITVSGNRVWFGTLTGGQVGYFDMNSQQFTMYHVTEKGALIFGMTADASGHIWFTELQAAYLGDIDPTTGEVTTQPVPKIGDTSTGLYQIVAARDGSIWFASAGANALVRYYPSTGAFVFYQLNASESVPYGLALDGSGNLWFTADGSPNYVAEVIP